MFKKLINHELMVKMGVSEILHVENLTSVFKSGNTFVKANDGIEFSLQRGEWLSILGKSGSGKSVVAKAISGILTGTPGIIEGAIFINGKNVLEDLCSEIRCEKNKAGDISNVRKQCHSWFRKYKENYRLIAPKTFAYISQNPIESFNPYLSIRSHVYESLLCGGEKKTNLEKNAAELMMKLGMSSEILCSYPHRVSGGELQRIAVGMAVSQDASIIIADECTTSLDHENTNIVLELLKNILSENVAIIFITHDEDLVFNRMSCSVGWMHKGKYFSREESYRQFLNESGQ